MFTRTRNDLIGSMKQFQGLVVDPFQRKASLPATWEDVEAAVSEVQSQWETRAEESKVAQAKGWLRKMGNGMNNHSAALRLLPMESEYFSIVGGSVSMIIKVGPDDLLTCSLRDPHDRMADLRRHLPIMSPLASLSLRELSRSTTPSTWYRRTRCIRHQTWHNWSCDSTRASSRTSPGS